MGVAGRLADRRAIFSRSLLRAAWGSKYGLALFDPVDPNAGIFKRIREAVPKGLYNDIRAISPMNSGEALNFFEGKIGARNVRIFDHLYTVSTRRSTRRIYHGVVAVQLAVEAPTFEIRPHQWWDKVTAMFGNRDIQIGHRGLDDMLNVTGSDETFVRMLFDSQTEGIMCSLEDTRVVCLGPTLVVIRQE